MLGRQRPKAKSRSLTPIREGATGFGMTPGGAARDGEGGESARLQGKSTAKEWLRYKGATKTAT